MKRKLFLATFAIVSIVGCSKKAEETNNPCEIYESVVYSLQMENMKLGGQLDSMILVHDYNYAFTN
jgi:hypothetical protein